MTSSVAATTDIGAVVGQTAREQGSLLPALGQGAQAEHRLRRSRSAGQSRLSAGVVAICVAICERRTAGLAP